MAKCRFLVSTTDSREGKEGTVYGAGHETDFDTDDYEFVMESWLAGKCEIYDTSGLTPPSQFLQGVPAETPPA